MAISGFFGRLVVITTHSQERANLTSTTTTTVAAAAPHSPHVSQPIPVHHVTPNRIKTRQRAHMVSVSRSAAVDVEPGR
ncbi:hypothetical protein SAMD00023353_3900660 [Rosellinia necatrix]|uniref:Uncharacterized protein n=1 Tax=Rosellinia necatrix TaxID=77044 RepID=A0A1S8A9H5_ROSNE|nr:hypothetical protein SAMD00023353_3900660 [Rosellinia necatrix]